MSELLNELPKLRTVTDNTSQAVLNATNEDTERATRMMAEKLQNIVKGLEAEMLEAQRIRNRITKRIVNLHAAANAARASLEALNNYGA